jgi:hypothetical protein
MEKKSMAKLTTRSGGWGRRYRGEEKGDGRRKEMTSGAHPHIERKVEGQFVHTEIQ